MHKIQWLRVTIGALMPLQPDMYSIHDKNLPTCNCDLSILILFDLSHKKYEDRYQVCLTHVGMRVRLQGFIVFQVSLRMSGTTLG